VLSDILVAERHDARGLRALGERGGGNERGEGHDGRKGLHGSSPWVEWASTRSCLRDRVRFSGELVHIERKFFRRLVRRRFADGIFRAPVSSRATRATQTQASIL